MSVNTELSCLFCSAQMGQRLMSRVCGLSALSARVCLSLEPGGVDSPSMGSCLRVGSWNLQGRSVVPRRLPGTMGRVQ